MTLKLSDVYKGNGYNGYVVASIISRDEEGYPDRRGYHYLPAI